MSSGWITPSAASILEVLPYAEQQLYRTFQTDGEFDTGDVLPGVIASAVAEVRGRVKACPNNTLAAGDTIPAECEHHFLAIVRYRLASRMGQDMGDQNDPRAVEYREARKFLEEVAACKVAVSPGEDPDADGSGANPRAVRPRATGRTRTFGRAQQDGL